MAVLLLIGVWLEKPDAVSALLNADLGKDDESGTTRAPPARRAAGGRGAITTARDMQAGVPDGERVAARAVGLHVCSRRRSGARTTRGRTGSVLTPVAGPWDVPLGGGMTRREDNYVPVLNQERLKSVEVVNDQRRTRREGKEGEGTEGA